MARRMFSPQIVDSDAFLDMSPSAQNLYFHLGMRADDDGFVGNPKKVLRMVGGNDDDLKVLLVKRFILSFDNGVVVIKHWRINNLVRKDWYKPTQYVEQKKSLFIKDTGAYTDDFNKGNSIVNETAPTLAQVRPRRLGKDRLGKDKEASKAAIDPIDLELSNLLLERILDNTPTFKKPLIESWASNVRLMREIDKRTPEQIRYVIDWSQKSNFWAANILSTKKLREKFDTLVSQIKRDMGNDLQKKSVVAFA